MHLIDLSMKVVVIKVVQVVTLATTEKIIILII